MLVEVQPSPLFFIFISQQARRHHYTQRAIIPFIKQCQNRVCSQPVQVQCFADPMLSKEDLSSLPVSSTKSSSRLHNLVFKRANFDLWMTNQILKPANSVATTDKGGTPSTCRGARVLPSVTKRPASWTSKSDFTQHWWPPFSSLFV